MAELVKIGCMRVVTSTSVSYISYKEFLNYDDATVSRLRDMVQKGHTNLFCACSNENNLPLSITENGVARVKNNMQQELHRDSCPKSIRYKSWVNSNKESAFLVTDEDRIIFNIRIPSVLKSSSSVSSNNTSSKSKDIPAHTSMLDTIKSLNAIAWEKQTYSKKKEIALANRNNEPQSWEYKDIESFVRLVFGVSNDITVKNGSNICRFIDLCYKKDVYFSTNDYTKRFFIYAQIDKVSEYKEDRKYQYVTVRMPSDKSNKTTLRIETELFNQLFENKDAAEGTHRFLSGYVHRQCFKDSDWMRLIKGNVFYTSLNGLYSENPYVASVFNYFCERHLIFKRCYMPVESYGGVIPTMIIERYRKKDILIDFVETKQMRAKRTVYARENEEYDIFVLLSDELSPKQVYDLVFSMQEYM